MASTSGRDAFRSWIFFFIVVFTGYVICYNETESSSVFTTVLSTTLEEFAYPEIHPNESLGYSKLEDTYDDNGTLAGTIIGVLGGIALIISLIAYLVYRQCSKNTITSMNFDNPVYRKTTEDQFSLEKNQYHPAGSYPPSLEPLTSPGTNEFV